MNGVLDRTLSNEVDLFRPEGCPVNTGEETTLTIDERATPNFGTFVASRLDELHRQFLEEGGQPRAGVNLGTSP